MGKLKEKSIIVMVSKWFLGIMVKTFLCHPFCGPKAFTDQYEPSAVCYTADDRVIIGSTACAIHIHNLKHSGCPKLQMFLCVGIPIKLLFCDNRQFIVSLEARAQDYKKWIVAKRFKLSSPCLSQCCIKYNK